MKLEQWRAAPGHPGYEVSDEGRVRSIDRTHMTCGGVVRHVRGRVLSPGITKGYRHVTLWADNRQSVRKVHQLVLEAFVGPRPSGLIVRHLNGDPGDNRLANLRYGTSSENEWDSVRHGTHFQARKTHCSHGHVFDEANTIHNGRQRICRACKAARDRRRYLARKAAA